MLLVETPRAVSESVAGRGTNNTLRRVGGFGRRTEQALGACRSLPAAHAAGSDERLGHGVGKLPLIMSSESIPSVEGK